MCGIEKKNAQTKAIKNILIKLKSLNLFPRNIGTIYSADKTVGIKRRSQYALPKLRKE
jgi:hypothetical protein